MSALKKNPLFVLVLVASLAAVGYESWQIYATRQKALRTAAQLEAKRQERDWLAHRSPSLNEDNAAAIAADVAALEQKSADLRASLAGRGQWLPSAPSISRDSYFALGKFTQHLKALAVEQQIVLRGEERFGFATYANEGPESDLIAPVHRQRVVVQHLIETLFEARPQSLIAVQREHPLTAAQRVAARTPTANGQGGPNTSARPTTAGQGADFFEPDSRLRLGATGLVEGELYRLEFTGQTQALRAFLNGLVGSPLPLIVRSVEVEPANGELVAPASIEPAEDSAVGTPPAAVPLVARNFSKFAVVIECVDVLPVTLAPAS